MIRIAVKMLMGDRSRYITLRIGLTAVSFLFVQQGSVFSGIIRRTAKPVDELAAPMWVCDLELQSIDDSKPAYFRDSYKGGQHRDRLLKIKVQGTADLLSHPFSAGTRRVVHANSSNVVTGAPGPLIDETMPRPITDADDYDLSKILSDWESIGFSTSIPDMFICLVLSS